MKTKEVEKKEDDNAKQHTPTPWTKESRGKEVWINAASENKEFIDPMTGNSGIDKSPKLVAIVKAFHLEEGESNAAFIVRAVNSHEALLKMAKYYHEIDDVSFKIHLRINKNCEDCKIIKEAEGK